MITYILFFTFLVFLIPIVFLIGRAIDLFKGRMSPKERNVLVAKELSKELWPEDYEDKDDTLERKKISRMLADKIITGEIELTLDDYGPYSDCNSIVRGKKTNPTLADQISNAQFQFLFRDICYNSVFDCLVHNLSILDYNQQDTDRMKKLQDVRDNFLKQAYRKMDDIINGAVNYGEEEISEHINWLEAYERKHDHMRYSQIEEARQKYLKDKKENDKRLVALQKILKDIKKD